MSYGHQKLPKYCIILYAILICENFRNVKSKYFIFVYIFAIGIKVTIIFHVFMIKVNLINSVESFFRFLIN